MPKYKGCSYLSINDGIYAANEQRDDDLHIYDLIENGACDAKIYVREAELLSTIITIVRKNAEILMGEAIRLKLYDNEIAAQKAKIDQEISELQNKMMKNKALLAGLYENFVRGILTRAEYLEMQEDYIWKIRGATELVRQLQTRQAKLEQQMQHFMSMADRLAEVDKDTALSALLVNQLIERITVNSSDDISIDFAFESGLGCVMGMLKDE